VTVDGSSNAVVRGTQVTYTLHVTNDGLIPALDVMPRLELDAGLAFGSATGATCTFAGSTATCDAGTLAPGATVNVAIVVNTLVTGGHAVIASATSVHPDPNPSDNQASALLTVAPLSDIGATLAAGALTVTRDSALAYTLTVANSATSDPTTAVARITLGNRLAYVSASGATCTHASGVVTCNLASIPAGGSTVVTINTTAIAIGAADASAVVEAFGLDPMPGDNNPAAATVTIDAPPPPPPPPASSSSGGGSSSGGKGGGALDAWTALLLLLLAGFRIRGGKTGSQMLREEFPDGGEDQPRVVLGEP
jgi:uncharacterized repeat protein (TIGR01451 family)